jgi:hypothetical protein
MCCCIQAAERLARPEVPVGTVVFRPSASKNIQTQLNTLGLTIKVGAAHRGSAAGSPQDA